MQCLGEELIKKTRGENYKQSGGAKPSPKQMQEPNGKKGLVGRETNVLLCYISGM